MRGRFIHQAVPGILLICQLTTCLATETQDPNNTSRYLNAVREFADNVLKYGRDTYGPKHTPLFVDGLNIHTHEPVKWISPKGDYSTATDTEEWILSNLASQQTLLRTLDGLSSITGDTKYRQAAMDSIKYAFEHLRTPSGIFYWGHLTAYDALGDTPRGNTSRESIKLHYPYYELMWRVDPDATRKIIEALWCAHVMDWSNLDFNRIGITTANLEEPWNHEYKGGPTFFKSKYGGGGFSVTGSSLIQAGTTLYRLSRQEQPLVWSKRLAKRFIDTRHPNTGISTGLYNNLPPRPPLGNDLKEHFRDPHTRVFPYFPFEEKRYLYYPENVDTHEWISFLLVGGMLGEKGRQFTQWALEELTAWGKASYRKKDNSFIPILTDGTNIEGYVSKEYTNYGPKGAIAKPLFTDLSFFWGYAVAYRATGDQFMWEMVRNIALGNNFGDTGRTPTHTPELQTNTISSDVYGLLGFLELYAKTNKSEFLQVAQRIGDNIVGNQFYKGFFVPSKRHIYTRFDCFEPLALLHLVAAIESKLGSVPQVWPSSPLFVPPYRYKQIGVDRQIIYTLTDSPEPPLSLQEAAGIGDVNMVRSLLDTGVGVDSWDDSFNKTALQRAAMAGHGEVVELLLAEGARIEARDAFPGGTALDYAAEKGHKEIAELLIARGADVNATRRGYPAGDRPLHSAARAGHKDIIELLIDKGADVNAKNDEGQTPLDIAMIRNRTNIAELLEARGADVSLHVAARVGALAKVKSLMEEVADINAKDASGQTALHYAARTRRKDIAELLIANGADVNAKNDEGQTPIDVALQRRRWNIVKDLIDAGADVTQVNADGQTLLHIAARRNQKDLVEILLDKGDDVNAGDNEGQTPLHMAAEGGHKEIIELLLARGARIDAKDHQGGKPALTALYGWSLPATDLLLEKGADATGPHLAAYTGDLSRIQNLLDANSAGDDYKGLTLLHTTAAGGQVKLVNYLIGKGLDVKASTEDGLTPLHYAAMGNHQDVAEILIAQGAPVDAGKTTPLFVAVWAGHKDMVKFLMSKGANINKGPKTPLHRAVSWWELDMAKLLLELGADINARDEEGNTPLHWTVNEWYMTMAKYLISKGADVDARNKQGRTPLHEAAHQWYTTMAKLLIENRASVRAEDEKGQTPLALAKQNGDTETVELLRKHGATE